MAGDEKILEVLFGAVRCIPVDIEIAQRAGTYLKQYAKSHSVELGDALKDLSFF
jgi:hypothetical protein